MAKTYHPLTYLLLIDVPEAHQRKFHEAVWCLDRCTSCLSATGVSNHLDEAIKLEADRLRALNKEFYLKSIFQMMVYSSCCCLAKMPNQSDALKFQTIAAFIKYKLNYSLQNKHLSEFPEDYCLTFYKLTPHLLHILELTLAELGRRWHTKSKAELKLPQKELTEKMATSLGLLTECEALISKKSGNLIAQKKKGLTVLNDKVRGLVASHNVEYYTLKKNEIDLCNVMLGPNATKRMPLIVTKLRLEYENKVLSNREKKSKLALFEEQGLKLKKIAEAYIEVEKKIKYTKATLNKLELML
ncbi:uncharacterized protein LOC135944877 [Cloeon dipterum]|uniref:uncharacterized protein LOC135944877 n=1 Tax=Cloeon dipterum TaxID=197152 RepID=UPI0032204ADA